MRNRSGGKCYLGGLYVSSKVNQKWNILDLIVWASLSRKIAYGWLNTLEPLHINQSCECDGCLDEYIKGRGWQMASRGLRDEKIPLLLGVYNMMDCVATLRAFYITIEFKHKTV